MQKLPFQRTLRITQILYILACVGAGGYVLLSGGPAARGLGGFAALLFPLAFPLLRRLFHLKKVPLMEATLLLFILLAFHLGVVLGLYSVIGWYDLAVHGLSGAVFALVGLCLYWLSRERKTAPLGEDALAATGYAFFFSQFVAGLWEIFEYVAFLLTGHDSQNVASTGVGDTMEDMMICLAGALLMGAAIWLHLRGKHRFYSLRPAEEFYRANFGGENEEAFPSAPAVDLEKTGPASPCPEEGRPEA